jgi:hypothetical protein
MPLRSPPARADRSLHTENQHIQGSAASGPQGWSEVAGTRRCAVRRRAQTARCTLKTNTLQEAWQTVRKGRTGVFSKVAGTLRCAVRRRTQTARCTRKTNTLKETRQTVRISGPGVYLILRDWVRKVARYENKLDDRFADLLAQVAGTTASFYGGRAWTLAPVPCN